MDRARKKKMVRKELFFKKSDYNASLLRKCYRYLGGYIAYALRNSFITPNMVTGTSFITSLVAAVLFALNHLISGVLLLFISLVLDKTDGSLARIKRCANDMGSWWDKSTDNVRIIMLFFAVTYNAAMNTEPLFYFIGFIGFGAFIAVKILYMFFREFFHFADMVFESEKKKHNLRSIFHFNEYFIINTMILAALLERFDILLIFYAVYGWLFYGAMYIYLSYKALYRNR